MIRKFLLFILLFGLFSNIAISQVMYSGSGVYGLRKLVTTYTGSAIQVIRACDNATTNIGFTSCGDLDTTSLKNFDLVPNPLSAMTAVSPAAYSLRKLSCTYAGSAIRVRRSSDNTTADIGFTSLGDLDTATMKTFVGANSGFVTIWYDQSGNSRDASQATFNDQPRIMNAGVIEYQGSRPAIRFQDISDCLQTANFTAYNSAACFNGVAKVNADLTGSYNTFVSKTGISPNNNFPSPFDFYYNVGGASMNQLTGNGVAATFFSPTQNFNAAQPRGIWTFCSSLAANTASLNASSILASVAAGTYSDRGQPINIGKRNDALTGLNGWIHEIVTFSVIPTTTDIRYLQWTQSIYYNISGPVLGTLPAGAKSASVTTWYDQSGNGINLQPTGSRRPLIVNAGNIIRQGLSGTWPAIQGTSAANTNLTGQFASAYSGTGLTINSVFRTDVNTVANARIVSLGNAALTSVDATSNNYFAIYQNNNNDFNVERNSSITPVTTGITVGAAMVLSHRFSGANRQLFYNGTGSTATVDNAAFNFSSIRLLQSIFPANESTQSITGKMSEFGIYFSSLSTTRRRLVESNQAAYHAITISNGKYTPPTSTTYNRFVVGIGMESATDSVCSTRESSGMGFTVSATASGFLKDAGDYMTSGINCAITNSTSVANISAPIQLRWQNDWYIDKTDVAGTAGGTVAIYFDFSDYNIGTSPGTASGYSLLNRPNTASNFTVFPATANVVGDRVYFTTTVSAQFVDSYFTIGSTYPPNSPLPIEILSFDAKKCNNDVCLNWVTATEKNNDYFIIERSTDADNWIEIKQVDGAGNSMRNLNYSEFDYAPVVGINYYRLKQVDFDKKVTYSKIESVEFKDELKVGVYPNPTKGSVSLSNCKNYDKAFVIDLLGRMVYSSDITKDSATLDLSQLQSGEYFITLINSVTEIKYTTKLIIDKK